MAVPRRRRLLQVALVVAGILAVAVSDRTASALARAGGPGTASALLAVAGHVAGGIAVGLALRLQVARRGRVDPVTRLQLGLPCGLVAAWPMVLSAVPAEVGRRLPQPLLDLQHVAPFAGAALGVVVVLAVAPRTR